MTRYPRKKYRGPQTWAAIREAYIAGETATALADSFDTTVSAIRKRATLEGWTRRQLNETKEAAGERTAAPVPALDGPPVSPSEALDTALALAAAHLRTGRTAEAAAAVRTGEGMAELARQAQTLRPKTLEEFKASRMEVWDEMVEIAEAAAYAALTDPEDAQRPLSVWAYHWRAEHFGPECAAADRARAVQGGWSDTYWDDQGRLRPAAEVAAKQLAELRRARERGER